MHKDDTWVSRIADCQKIKRHSQSGEEGYLKFILDNVGSGERKFFMDIGAGDGYNLSNTRIFKEYYGYEGVFIDGQKWATVDVHQEWVTNENIVSLFEKYGCPEGFSLLSLDLDGNDYDILTTIMSRYKPRVVICEINGTVPLGVSVKIKYNPEHVWKGADYYGFSFSACEKLAEKMGYRIVLQTDSMNVYMVRRDLLADPDNTPAVQFHHQNYHAHDPLMEGGWEEV